MDVRRVQYIVSLFLLMLVIVYVATSHDACTGVDDFWGISCQTRTEIIVLFFVSFILY